ncbi:MAG: hypothetical protein ACRDYU_05475 [Actinomycetes bacterium]
MGQYFATAGPGSLVGIAVGWAAFALFASPVPDCVVPACLPHDEMWGMAFMPFVMLVAALGGLIGLLVGVVKGDIL